MAQQSILSGQESGTNLNVLYSRDFSGKIYATARGYGASFHQGKHITARTRSFYEIDIQTQKHSTKIKSVVRSDEKNRLVFGTLNNVLLLRGSLGLQNTLFAKADNKAVEVRYSYCIGPVFAFAKPYYVRIYKQTVPGNRNLYDNVRFDDENVNSDSLSVAGHSAFSVGLNEMKIYPGINGKFNLSFEYASYTNLIRAIETGVSLDYFPKALPIMVKNPAENLIINVYIGFVFGNKWF